MMMQAYQQAAAAHSPPQECGVYGNPCTQFVSPPRSGSRQRRPSQQQMSSMPPPSECMSNAPHRLLTAQTSMVPSPPAPEMAERFLDAPPSGMPSHDDDGNPIRYVEVPVIEEVVRYVPVRQEVIVEKTVPRYEEVWVDKVVEVPEVAYQDRIVEQPIVQESVVHVPRVEVIEIPKEVIRQVPKVQTRIVEAQVEVPGPVIEVPQYYTVENKISVPKVVDKQVPILVAQVVHPLVTGVSDEVRTVELIKYQPQFQYVDVPVPRPVTSCLINHGVLKEQCKVVQVPAAQYNTLLRHLNRHLDVPEKQQFLPYVPDSETNTIPFLEEGYMPSGHQPIAVPVPLINSPAPASVGRGIASTVVNSPRAGLHPSPLLYPAVLANPPVSLPIDMDKVNVMPRDALYDVPSPVRNAAGSVRHHGKPRHHQSHRHKQAAATHRSGAATSHRGSHRGSATARSTQ